MKTRINTLTIRLFSLVLALVLLSGVFSSFITPQTASAATTTGTLLPLNQLPARTTEATYTYCTFGTTGFKMDFYRPTGWGAVPVILNVHGGGWALGDRTSNVKADEVSAFLNKGIAFATIDYQLWNGRKASNDTACAVRYLRASAAQLGLNGRVGAMGQSAGGQLVSLLGVTDKSAGFDIGQYPNQSSRVDAILDQWGPVIFDSWALNHFQYLAQIFGSSDLTVLQQYSPLTYLTKDDPPFLIIQGWKDTNVLPYQSQNFAAALKQATIPVQLIMVQNAGHYLAHSSKDPPMSPTAAQIQTDMVNFFVKQLRN